MAIALMAAYSVVHFAYSGVAVSLATPNIRQIAYEIRPLNAHLATGAPVTLDESDPYGPVFFFVMHPLLVVCSGNAWPLSRCLFAVQLTALAAAFLFTWLSLRWWLTTLGYARAVSGAALAAALAFVWLNFAPLYYIVATKMVEMWELALIMAGLYAYVRGRRGLAGVAIAAATFIKLLPGIFALYLVLHDRRALAGVVAGSLAILALAHALYGPAMGFAYPAHVVRAAVVPSADAATGRHENLAMKNLVWKALGTLTVPGSTDPPTMPEAYAARVRPEDQRLAAVIGLVLHLVALMVTLWAIWPRRSQPPDVVWAWAWLSVALLVVAPAATFEYMLLSIPAFSLMAAALLASPGLRQRKAIVLPFAIAILLVAVVVPRSVLNHLLPIDLLRRVSGYTHLTLSETYQYFGVPLIGLFALAGALLVLRRPGHGWPAPATRLER